MVDGFYKFGWILLVCGILLPWSTDAAAAGQKEFGKKRKYDATHCVTLTEGSRVLRKRKRKISVIYAENRCSRPIHALGCFNVIKASLKFSRTGWYCKYKEFKSRSRAMFSERAKYGRVKKWAACNGKSEDCIRILQTTEGIVNSGGQDPEKVARRLK